jgi:hypothetical protein
MQPKEPYEQCGFQTPILDALDRFYRKEVEYQETVDALRALMAPQWVMRELEKDFQEQCARSS